jgi:hypothetical protein
VNLNSGPGMDLNPGPGLGLNSGPGVDPDVDAGASRI